jgi:hypothetical protein
LLTHASHDAVVDKSELRASPAVLSTSSCTVKLDEEKSKYASLALENGSGSAELHSLLWLVKAQQALPMQKRV